MRIATRLGLVIALVLLTVGAVTHGSQLTTAAADFYTRVQVFERMMQIIQHNYVDEVDVDELFDSAIAGALEELDPHSRYYTAEQFQQLQEDYRGDYAGIGIAFELFDFAGEDQVITVIDALEGGPSAALGLRPGDQIVRINGEDATGTTVQQVYDKLRGPRGTRVDVTVRRPGLDELLDYTITRGRVAIAAIRVATMVAPEVGYIHLGTFSQRTSSQLEAALHELEDRGMRRLILDLRRNGGGLMSQAIQVTDKFLEAGRTILKTHGRTPTSNSDTESTSSDTHPRIPMIVLVNRTSASASEIVSGALQDWDRALIVGETSFGKGLVQNQFQFKDGSALFLTIARYYTPSGRLIQRDYEDKEVEEYFNPDLWDEEQSDEDSADQTPIEDRPVYHTAAGREVFGGGGIHPDIEIDPTRVSRLALGLYSAPFRMAFQFGIEYAALHAAEITSFDDYLADFEVTDEIFEQFVEFLRRPYIRKRMDEVSVPLDDEALGQASDDLRIYLKADIAAAIWGQEHGREVLLQRDAPGAALGPPVPTGRRAADAEPQAGQLIRLPRLAAAPSVGQHLAQDSLL